MSHFAGDAIAVTHVTDVWPPVSTGLPQNILGQVPETDHGVLTHATKPVARHRRASLGGPRHVVGLRQHGGGGCGNWNIFESKW